MLGRLLSRVFAMLFGCLVGLGVCELGLAKMGSRDIDGNRGLGSKRLKPYHLPERNLEELLASYRNQDSSSVVYDPDLGWVARPLRKKPGFRTNSAGIRTGDDATEYSPAPPPGTLRVALFGDSFTESALPYEESWAHALSMNLRTGGVQAEVLNFGVGGYGIDQAYLAWRSKGRQFAPHVVVMGFQPENVKRGLNLIRLIYEPRTGLPFAKPRFVLESGRLALRNVPTPLPDSLPAIIGHMAAWPLVSLERFYVPRDFQDHWWLKSKVAAYTAEVLADGGGQWEARERKSYDPRGEGGAVALATIGQFAAEAESSGAAFVLVHMPRREDLDRISKRQPLLYQSLLTELRRRHTVLETSDSLTRVASDLGLAKLFGATSHYGPDGDRIVARLVADHLLAHPIGRNGSAASDSLRKARPQPAAARSR